MGNLGIVASSRRVPVTGYRAAVMADSPIAYYRLGEPSGTNAADEVAAHAGTYTNSPTLGVASPLIGDANTAITLLGSSTQYVTATAGGTFNVGLSDYSVEFWFKHTSRSTMFIVDYNSEAGNAFEAWWDGDHLNSRVGGTNPDVLSGGANGFHADGVWHHAVIVMIRAGNGQWYVDGAASGSPVSVAANSGVSISGTNPFLIGKRTGGLPYTGSLDEVAVYTTALSGARITAHYHAAGY